MASEANITAEHNWFCGADRIFDFVLTEDVTSVGDLEWTCRQKATEDDFLIQKFSVANPTQLGVQSVGPPIVVRLSIEGDDTVDLKPGTYHHALKDLNTDRVYSFGTAVLQQVATH